LFGITAWHFAADRGRVAILEKLWNLAKELQLKPEEITNEVLLSKTDFEISLEAEIDQVELFIKLWNWDEELQPK
jgi:hypothetical protein